MSRVRDDQDSLLVWLRCSGQRLTKRSRVAPAPPREGHGIAKRTAPSACPVACTMKNMFKKVFGGSKKDKEQEPSERNAAAEPPPAGGAVRTGAGTVRQPARPVAELPDRQQADIQALLREQEAALRNKRTAGSGPAAGMHAGGERRVQCPQTGKWYTESEIIAMEALKSAQREKAAATAKSSQAAVQQAPLVSTPASGDQARFRRGECPVCREVVYSDQARLCEEGSGQYFHEACHARRAGGQGAAQAAAQAQAESPPQTRRAGNAGEEALPESVMPPPAEAPLPPGWKTNVDKASGKTYYYNKELKKTQWERPAADRADAAVLPPPAPAVAYKLAADDVEMYEAMLAELAEYAASKRERMRAAHKKDNSEFLVQGREFKYYSALIEWVKERQARPVQPTLGPPSSSLTQLNLTESKLMCLNLIMHAAGAPAAAPGGAARAAQDAAQGCQRRHRHQDAARHRAWHRRHHHSR